MEENKTPIKEETIKKKEKFVWTWKSFFFSFLWLAVLIVAIDLGTKWGVVNFFRENPIRENPKLSAYSLEIIPHFFYITLSFNKGSSFGMGGDITWMRYIFIIISWLASAAILYYWIKNLYKKDYIVDCILALALGGALGNAIDRTFYWDSTVGFSGVVDFFQFYIFGFDHDSFAIFNVADAALVVGMIILIIVILVRSIKEAKLKK